MADGDSNCSKHRSLATTVEMAAMAVLFFRFVIVVRPLLVGPDRVINTVGFLIGRSTHGRVLMPGLFAAFGMRRMMSSMRRYDSSFLKLRRATIFYVCPEGYRPEVKCIHNVDGYPAQQVSVKRRNRMRQGTRT